MPKLSQDVGHAGRMAVAAALAFLGMAAAGAQTAAPLNLRPLFSTSICDGSRHFAGPLGLAFDSTRDEIYVADTGNHQIVVLSRNGAPRYRFTHWVRDASGARVPGEPWAVLPGAQGTVFVSDRLSDRVDVLDFRGALVRSVDVTAALGGRERAQPGRMARDVVGNIYLVEHTTSQVLVFDAGWRLVRRLGGRGKAQGGMEMIADVAVSPDGTAYVLDSRGLPTVEVFDREGQWVTGFGKHGDRAQHFHLPVGLAWDDNERIWIADAFSHDLKAYTTSGVFLGAFGEAGEGTGQFYFPSDVVVLPGGSLYVLEKAGARLQGFAIEAGQPAPPAGPQR